MSYIIVKVYSFECDHPDCGELADVTPAYRAGIREARRELVREYAGWVVRPTGEFCPRHAGSGAA